MNIRNAVWASEAKSCINCELNHEIYGWIPFTASQNDVDENGKEIFNKLINNYFGDIADYVPPPPPPPPPETIEKLPA